MLVCIIQMPYDSCVMMTSVVLYVKLENSKIITKLLGLMGDKTRVVHQKKKIHDEIHNVGILTGKSGPD